MSVSVKITITLVLSILAGSLLYSALQSERTATQKGNIETAPAFLDVRGERITGTAGDPALAGVLAQMASSSIRSEDPPPLSIDADLQRYAYEVLERYVQEYAYSGGSAVIMEVESGELRTVVSYPGLAETETLPLSVTEGLYAPGSTIKPFVALAALEEGIIDPGTEIVSTGAIQLPNPFQPSDPFIYKDWKAHGPVDMRRALGVSSNVYFYAIGGGYEDQPGLGIDRLRSYLTQFGFGVPTGLVHLPENAGTLPGPDWKADVYGDEWRLGDTYLVSIGQHGYQITPLQLARATVALAARGVMVTPTILHGGQVEERTSSLPFAHTHYSVVQDGMEYAVVGGTAAGLYIDEVSVAAKTGTAEVDDGKQFIHSWVTGYFPAHEPRYVFVLLLNHGPRGEEVGAVAASRELLLWLRDQRPEYVR